MSAMKTHSDPIREMICISCPIGCHLQLFTDENEELVVKGNRCPRGKEYATEEYYAPKRVVTATARTADPSAPRLPVRTDKPLPKEHIDDLVSEVYRLNVALPVDRGAVLIENFRNTGVNLVSSLTLGK
jgi:CxxC motif-containing protein